MLVIHFSLQMIITSEMKFFHVLSALPSELVVKLPDSILTNKNYDILRKSVLRYFTGVKMTSRASHYL